MVIVLSSLNCWPPWPPIGLSTIPAYCFNGNNLVNKWHRHKSSFHENIERWHENLLSSSEACSASEFSWMKVHDNWRNVEASLNLERKSWKSCFNNVDWIKPSLLLKIQWKEHHYLYEHGCYSVPDFYSRDHNDT